MDRSDRAIITQAQDEYHLQNAGVLGAVEMFNADGVADNLIGLALIKYRGAFKVAPVHLVFRSIFSGQLLAANQYFNCQLTSKLPRCLGSVVHG